MTLLLSILGGLALALGSGVVFLALLGLEEDEPEGFVSKGWRIRHAPGGERENQTIQSIHPRWWS